MGPQIRDIRTKFSVDFHFTLFSSISTCSKSGTFEPSSLFIKVNFLYKYYKSNVSTFVRNSAKYTVTWMSGYKRGFVSIFKFIILLNCTWLEVLNKRDIKIYFCITAFTALLDNVYQQPTFLYSISQVFADWRPSPTSLFLYCLPSQLSVVSVAKTSVFVIHHRHFPHRKHRCLRESSGHHATVTELYHKNGSDQIAVP